MNAEPIESIFRKEAIDYRADRLHGEVSIALPLSWQAIGYLLLAVLTIGLIFLAMASYSRVETATGSIVIDKGVASIVPSRNGVVVALFAREGQSVEAGQSLVAIRSEEDMGSGGTAQQRVLEALAERDRRLSSQTDLVMSAAGAEVSRWRAQISGLVDELASLAGQIQDQRRLIEVAENDFRESQTVASKGFISRRDLDVRESSLIGRRQQLSQLLQTQSSKTAELAQARRLIVQAQAQAQAQAAGVQSSRAELAQEMAETQASQGYSLRAPINGIVTAVTARLGQPAQEGQSLMYVVPQGGSPQVELYAPSTAIGFLAPGQRVRLAVDAFPYQRFGTIEARITNISSTAIPRRGPDGATAPAYLITASLKEPWVMAFGRKQPLLPGMGISARIVTKQQSLFEWVFEPIFAVRRR